MANLDTAINIASNRNSRKIVEKLHIDFCRAIDTVQSTYLLPINRIRMDQTAYVPVNQNPPPYTPEGTTMSNL